MGKGRKRIEGVERKPHGDIKKTYRRSPWNILQKGIRKQGFPPKWTKEELDKIADQMHEWIMSHPEVLFVRPFFTNIKMRISTVYDVLHVSDKFREMYRYCQQICADRLHDGVLKNKLNGNYATRFMHYFDRELNKKDRENEKQNLEQTIAVTKTAEIGCDGIKVILEVRKEE